MSNRKNVIALAACAALASAGLVKASDSIPNSQGSLSLTPTFSADDAAPKAPLMHLLDDAGAGSMLDEWGINISGFVEGSYTADFRHPPGNLIAGREFDIQNESIVLNQLDLFIQRAVAPSPTKWDFGAGMEWIYGADAQFIHSNGLFDWQGFQNGPQNQFDPVQAYVQANIPVGNGLVVTGGKTVSLIGYETINPTTNNLFSHSFMFYFSGPFTTTGLLAKYVFDKTYSATLGIVRGWDQALKDNNSAASVTGQLTYNIDQLSFMFNFITGPEETNNNGDYRTLLDPILVYTPDDKWTFALELNYGFGRGVPTNGQHSWFGTTGYATYKLNQMFALQGRVEYFDDGEDVRGVGTQLGEITLGVNVKPFPNDAYGSGLMFRPEIRYDWSTHNVYQGGTKDNQTTFGIDAIYAF